MHSDKAHNNVYSISSSFPENFIYNNWNKGRGISSLYHVSDQWAVLMSRFLEDSHQYWYTRDSFPKECIKDGWDEDHYINSLAYGQGLWAVCLSDNIGYTHQKWVLEPQFPDESINKCWDRGLYITNIAYGKGKWATVFTEGVPYTSQMWRTRIEFPDEIIREYYEKEYFITTLAYDNDMWVLVMSLNAEFSHQKWKMSYDFPNQFIDSALADGYEITDLVYGQGVWAVVVSKMIYLETGEIDGKDKTDKYQGDTLTLESNKKQSDQLSQEVTLESAISELEYFIGMESIKKDISTLINYIKAQKLRKEQGLPQSKLSLHSVFLGPPGTGKTSVARVLGKIFKALGILSKGHVIEVDRSQLVAGYIGQTAIKTNEIIDSALDGILFIDEAYSLAPTENNGQDFGREAIEALIKRMEDDRDRLIVIVAGYLDEMKHFINSNPGLEDRFNRYFHFEGYSKEELVEIFKKFCKKEKYKLTLDAEAALIYYFGEEIKKGDSSFGNGRYARNIFQKAIMEQSNRILKESEINKTVLSTLTVDDILIAVKGNEYI